MSILFEFEKLYRGDPSQTMAICEKIAVKLGKDVDEVADYVYTHRYADADAELLEGYDETEPTLAELEKISSKEA